MRSKNTDPHLIKYMNMKRENIICTFIMIGSIFLFSDTALSARVKHIHPPQVMPPPRPITSIIPKKSIYKWSVRDIINAIKDSGIEINEIRRGIIVGPPGASETSIFTIPGYGKDKGGLIASFSDEDALINAWIYYSAMNTNPEHPAWHIYRMDNIIMLISGRIPPHIRKRFEEVIYRLSTEDQ
jgi:hypothetical protein